MPVASPRVTCTSGWRTINQRVSQPSPRVWLICSSSSQNSETFYLVDHTFTIQGSNSGMARWKRCIGQVMGKKSGASMPPLRAQLSPNLHVFTNLEALRTLTFWGFMEASLHRHSWLNHWPLTSDSTSRPSPLPRGQRAGTEISTL